MPQRILLQLDTDPQPSTFDAVVAVDAGADVLLRHGGVTVEDLAAVLPDVDAPDRTVVPEDQAAPAPGTFLRHYSPATPLVLVEGPAEVVAAANGNIGGEAGVERLGTTTHDRRRPSQ